MFVAGALSPAITAGKHVLVMGRCSTLTLGFALVHCCSFTLKNKSDCTDNIVSLLGVHFLFHRFHGHTSLKYKEHDSDIG